MKDLKSYYNRANLTYGVFLGITFVGLFFLFGMTSFWGAVILFVLVVFSTPAVMARNDAIRKWEKDNYWDRM